MSADGLISETQSAARTVITGPGGGRVVWRIWGAGPPLVLLHGDAGSWTHWIRNVARLSRGLTVIVPDLPGYGDSDMPPESWSPESVASLLAEEVRDILPSGPYCLAGFSFGGIIAGHLAAADRERVTQLILVGAGGMALPGAPPDRPLRRVHAGMSEPEITSAHRHNLAVLMFANPARIDDLAVRVQAENVARARLRVGSIPASDSLLHALARVKAKLHGIWGERDNFMAPYVHLREDALRRFQPDASFRTIAGAGHWTPYEASEEVNDALAMIVGTCPSDRRRGAR